MKRAVLLLLVGAALILGGCRETSASGSAIYFTTCSACHGVDLAGSIGGALTAGSAAADFSDLEYRTVIRQGSTDMPSNGSLTEAQLDALIAYIRSVQAE